MRFSSKTTINSKLRFASLVALIFSALALSGCGAGVTPLTFSTLSQQSMPAESPDAPPRLIVLTQSAAVAGISPADQQAIERVDYSGSIVVVAFFGFGDLAQTGISQVSELISVIGKTTVWVQGAFPATEDKTTLNYHVITVDRSQFAQTGMIQFRLIDDQKREKASAQANFS